MCERLAGVRGLPALTGLTLLLALTFPVTFCKSNSRLRMGYEQATNELRMSYEQVVNFVFYPRCKQKWTSTLLA